MGAIMGMTGAWVLLWIMLALAVGVTSGIMIARGVHSQRRAAPPPIPPADSPAMGEAKAALRLRYANGEISPEDYLQGKFELQD